MPSCQTWRSFGGDGCGRSSVGPGGVVTLVVCTCTWHTDLFVAFCLLWGGLEKHITNLIFGAKILACKVIAFMRCYNRTWDISCWQSDMIFFKCFMKFCHLIFTKRYSVKGSWIILFMDIAFLLLIHTGCYELHKVKLYDFNIKTSNISY